MPNEMTSKERVRTTFAHEEPDRAPVNYLANAEIDLALKRHFGLADDDGEGIARRLGVDFRGVWTPYIGHKRHADLPGVNVDEWGVHRRWVEHETGGYWDYCDWPLANATLAEVEAWPLPSPDDYNYSAVAATCRRQSEYFTFCGDAGVGDIINSNGMLRTMEQVLVDLISDDPAGLRLIDRRLAVKLEIVRRTLSAGAGMFDALWIGEDLGTQRGPTLSLELFRRHIRPRMQQFVDLAKAWHIPVIIHSCGSSSWAFDDFVEMGISIVDTLQPEAKDMAPAYLKRRYGQELCFHGMISTGGPLAYGSADDVARNVRETLATMMPGGGYALAPTHCIQSNSPVANVLALYETARAFGVYGRA
jgi:hypothetical protein